MRTLKYRRLAVELMLVAAVLGMFVYARSANQDIECEEALRFWFEGDREVTEIPFDGYLRVKGNDTSVVIELDETKAEQPGSD